MNHQHAPQGQNTMNYAIKGGKRFQWACCECGLELRRETTPEGASPNWTPWEAIKEFGLKSGSDEFAGERVPAWIEDRS